MKGPRALHTLLITEFCLVVAASAADTPITLTAGQAAQHVGELARVCGVVASAKFAESSSRQPTFLNLDKAFPTHIFTVVIWGQDRRKFGAPESAYANKRLCVTGTIQLYRGRPQIIATEASQIVADGALRPVPSAPGASRVGAGSPPGSVPRQDMQVLMAQVALRSIGLYLGGLDGVLGPGTRAALARFQAARGLPSTGELDQVTLALLVPQPSRVVPLPRSWPPIHDCDAYSKRPTDRTSADVMKGTLIAGAACCGEVGL